MWPRPLATLCNGELVVDAVGGGRAVKVSERLLTRFVSGPGPGLHRSTALSPVLSPSARHGSTAKLVMRSGRVEVHADHPDQSVQRTPFSGRGDCSVRPLVPTLSCGSPKMSPQASRYG